MRVDDEAGNVSLTLARGRVLGAYGERGGTQDVPHLGRARGRPSAVPQAAQRSAGAYTRPLFSST